MKKYICTALALLVAASMFVGCGCTNRNVSDQPNGIITDPTTGIPGTNPMPTMTTPTEESTRATTEPHRETTTPTQVTTEPGSSDHTGATGSVTDSTGESTHPGNSRSSDRWPDRHS